MTYKISNPIANIKLQIRRLILDNTELDNTTWITLKGARGQLHSKRKGRLSTKSRYKN